MPDRLVRSPFIPTDVERAEVLKEEQLGIVVYVIANPPRERSVVFGFPVKFEIGRDENGYGSAKMPIAVVPVPNVACSIQIIVCTPAGGVSRSKTFVTEGIQGWRAVSLPLSGRSRDFKDTAIR